MYETQDVYHLINDRCFVTRL